MNKEIEFQLSLDPAQLNDYLNNSYFPRIVAKHNKNNTICIGIDI